MYPFYLMCSSNYSLVILWVNAKLFQLAVFPNLYQPIQKMCLRAVRSEITGDRRWGRIWRSGRDDWWGGTHKASPSWLYPFFLLLHISFFLFNISIFHTSRQPPNFYFLIFFLLQGAHCGRSGDRQRECPYLTLLFENISVSTNKSICLLIWKYFYPIK